MTVYLVMMSSRNTGSRHVAALFEDVADAERYVNQQKDDEEYWYYINKRNMILSRHHENQGEE